MNNIGINSTSSLASRATRPGVGAGGLKTLFLLLALSASPHLFAEPVTPDQARSAVTGWLKADSSPLQARMGNRITQVERFADADGVSLYYVVDLESGGFVVVPADDLIEPIIAFAPSGRFDPSSNNPLSALVSQDLPGRIAKVKGIAPDRAHGSLLAAKNKWSRLEQLEQGSSGVELGIGTVSDVRVAPLTQTLWNQETAGGYACYNYYTPPNAAGSAANYPCGCVATAMAQLMRFWQYPVNGVGTASFSIMVNGVTQNRNLLGGNGAGGPYVWTSMVLNPTGGTPAQNQAIGALCADAGVSVNMQYTSSGSGSDTLQAKTALVSTFGYANAIKGYNGNATIGAGLNGMINPDLDGGYPVILGITGPPGGHAIVCDGYGYNLSTLYHHLNLGWSGQDTAWYALPTIDTSIGTFNSVYKCIYNVWTNGSGEIISGRVTDGSGSPVTGVVLTATRTGGGTYVVTNNSHGIYAFAKIPSSSTFSIGAVKGGYAFANQIVTTGSSADYSATSGNQWGVDFVQTDSNNPTAFSATSGGSSVINLSWGKNPSGDNVMVAWNTSASFGNPSGSYSAGDTIVGGGTVLYNGGATTVSHNNLTPGTIYYYRAWSVRSGPSYSSGVACSASTVSGIPFTEDFEHAGALPNGWTEEYVTGAADWTFASGDGMGVPAGAHGGGYNALLFVAAESDHKTKLVTPMLDFGTATNNAQLTFWHFMETWPPDQDELRVYYKNSPGAAWTLLATYTTTVAAWTQRTIPLPNPSSTYYVAFEGNARYGYGVCIDDVAITAQRPMSMVCSFPLDTDPGWTRQGQWAFGHPAGLGGATYGHPDPANGATGANVFGVNLSGDYSTAAGGPYYLVAGPVDFSGCTDVTLQFQRWLNTDYQPFAYATIDVSSDGINWTPCFSNGSSTISDAAWTGCEYDISATARNQANVYVRWGYQIASGAFAYSGWNIDDVRFFALPQRMPHMGMTLSGTNLLINCAYGTPSGTCYVLMSTNISLPRANWTVVGSNIFDGTGCCVITNRLSSNLPQQYFLLRSQ